MLARIVHGNYEDWVDEDNEISLQDHEQFIIFASKPVRFLAAVVPWLR
jgi:hypothetical protein